MQLFDQLVCVQHERWVKKLKQCAAIEMMQQSATTPLFVLGELHSQKQAQLKVGAFESQPSVYQY
jgi:hypothetical protein